MNILQEFIKILEQPSTPKGKIPITLFFGRFQPLTLAHLEIIKMLKKYR